MKMKPYVRESVESNNAGEARDSRAHTSLNSSMQCSGKKWQGLMVLQREGVLGEFHLSVSKVIHKLKQTKTALYGGSLRIRGMYVS